MSQEKRQVVQLPLAAITFVLVLGALSMVWPAIIALFLGVALLLQSFTGQLEVAVLQ